MRFILVFIIISFNVYPQNYRIIYGKSNAMTKEALDAIKDNSVKNNVISMSKSFDQLQYELLISGNRAKFSYVENLSTPNFNKRAISVGGGGDIYYFDKDKNTLVFQTNLLGKDFFVEKKINALNWEITKETKLIDSYKCYKANAKIEYNDFRGKSYYEIEAWFCPDFQFSYGPDEYYGLPGLVFEAGKKQSPICFQLKKIEMLDDKLKQIEIPEGELISQEEFTRIFNEEMKKLTE